jgi:hypothetical protein
MHSDWACSGNRWVRFRNASSLADRIDPNDYRASMACLSLQALTISGALKAWRAERIARRHDGRDYGSAALMNESRDWIKHRAIYYFEYAKTGAPRSHAIARRVQRQRG